MERSAPEPIDEITQALPGHHLDQRVAHEISVFGIDITLLDIGQRVRKLHGWCIREAQRESAYTFW
jgi:hypothetical protein